jgi:hypothetical protein
MRPVRVLTAAALTVVVATPAPLALGDADPPSDFLYLQDAYYPYHPKVSTQQQKRLDDLLKRTKRAGFPIKVAIIATPTDLGGIPMLFGRPQRYAHFLEQELSIRRNTPLLTVMPAGYGTAAAGPRAAAIVARLPRSTDPNAMASAAVTAVEQLATANGHPVDTTNLGSKAPARQPSSSPVLLFAPILAVALIGAVATVIVRLRRRARDSGRPFDWSGDA